MKEDRWMKKTNEHEDNEKRFKKVCAALNEKLET